MELTLRRAILDDVELLATMNQRLIEDEKSRNPMSIEEIKDRMNDFIQKDWQADLILFDSRVIGYALYQVRPDDYDPHLSVVYIRQYFICRDHRAKGYGRTAFQLLKEIRFRNQVDFAIDVLATNSSGKRFWDSVGFEEYSTSMKHTRNNA